MDLTELQRTLTARDADPYGYYIAGITPGPPRGLGELVIEPDGSRWVVYTTERGTDFNHHYFESEDEACRYLLEQAPPRQAPGPPLTAEQQERATASRERQVARHREALEKRGVDPDTGLPVNS